MLRTEIRLLLACAGTGLNSAAVEQIKIWLHGGLDWPYLIALASRHGLITLLYHNLSQAAPEAVPKRYLIYLAEQYRAIARYNLFLSGELLKVLALFEEKGLPAIPYKGPLLAASGYGHISLRQFSDLDILVRKRDFLPAGKLLIEQGYRLRASLNSRLETVERQPYRAYAFIRSDGRALVDLHWDVTRLKSFSLRPDREICWQALDQGWLLDRPVPTLPPEILLLSLCIHGSRHAWKRLGWICDVAQTAGRQQTLDWSYTLRLAERTGNSRVLQLGLLLAHKLLALPLPRLIIRNIQGNPTVATLADRVRKRLFQEIEQPLLIFDEWRLCLSLQEKWADRVSYSWQLALTPTFAEQAQLPLPASLSFLYYLVRPLRLLGKYGRARLIRSHRLSDGR